MKLIKPKAEILIQQPGLEGLYKQIELAGRTCYKSEDKITDYSANKFVVRMIESNHCAMLEHGTVYLKCPKNAIIQSPIHRDSGEYFDNPYTKINYDGLDIAYITTNYRVIIENGWQDDLQYLCEPTEHHERRYTFKVTTSIGVTRELNRHRVNSIAEQSTRYCNYSKDKFGNEITFCIPSWINIPEGNIHWDGAYYINSYRIESDEYDSWIMSCDQAERSYNFAIRRNWKPQQAREVLPLCTATEAVYTAFESDWEHFFELRYEQSTGKVHPNMLELTTLMKKEYESYTKEKRN